MAGAPFIFPISSTPNDYHRDPAATTLHGLLSAGRCPTIPTAGDFDIDSIEMRSCRSCRITTVSKIHRSSYLRYGMMVVHECCDKSSWSTKSTTYGLYLRCWCCGLDFHALTITGVACPGCGYPHDGSEVALWKEHPGARSKGGAKVVDIEEVMGRVKRDNRKIGKFGKNCGGCGKRFKSSGLKAHERKCKVVKGEDGKEQ